MRRRGGTVICETHHGFVCANAGVDSSNAPDGTVVLLPATRTPRRAASRRAMAAAVGGGWGSW